MSKVELIIAFIEPFTSGSGYRYLNGFVLRAIGEAVENELEEQGRLLDDGWEITEIPPDGTSGISVWEGECLNLWSMNHRADWEPQFDGRWRGPTSEELDSVKGVIVL